MATKLETQSFVANWNKTVNWAKQNKIPQAAYYPVYQQDAQRLVTGATMMGESERIHAILASANPNNVTALPTDVPQHGIGGFFHNLEHDAANIFTGLQPTHLVNSIYHSALNSFEHPNWLLDPTKNTLAQLIPGVSLVGEYEEGGMSNVFAHPLITALNVLGLASAGTALIGRTAAAEAITSALKLPEGTQIGGRAGMGPISLGAKALANIPMRKTGFAKDVAGDTTFGKLTVGNRLSNWTNTKGAGRDLADINKAVDKSNQAGNARFAASMRGVADANAALRDQTVPITTDAEAKLYNAEAGTTLSASHAAYNLVTMSGKSWSALAADDLVPAYMKPLIASYQSAIESLTSMAVDKGELVRLRLPDGTVQAYHPAEAGVLTRARDKWYAAEEKAARAGDPVSAVTANIQRVDAAATPLLTTTLSSAQRIKAVVTRPLSQELRTTLTPTDKADQAWHDLGLNHDTVSSLLSVPKATLTQGRLIAKIFNHGGLLDQIDAAYKKEDFPLLRTLTRQFSTAMHNKAFTRVMESNTALPASVARDPEGNLLLGNPVFNAMRQSADRLYAYAKTRAKDEKRLTATLTPRVKRAQLASEKLLKDYEDTVWKHPAPVWQPLYVRLMNKYIAEDEKGALLVNAALSHAEQNEKLNEATLTQIRSDPAKLVEAIRTYMRASHTSPFGTELDAGIVAHMQNRVLHDISSLRAKGFVPHYVPNFSSRDSTGAYDPAEASYTININPTHYSTPNAAHRRLMEMSNTIYDIHAGMNLGMKQRVMSDGAQELIDNFLIPRFGHKQSDLVPTIERENPGLLFRQGGTSEAALAHYLEDTLDLGRFDPTTFGLTTSHHLTGGDTIWMPKAILRGLEDTMKQTGWKGFDPSGVVATGTKVFRESILGYSPRFVAHIGFGGAFLMAGREPLSFAFLPRATRMLRDPEFRAAIHTRSTQIGAADPISWGVREFHHEGGKTMGRMWIQEKMDQLGLDASKVTSWLQVIPQLTFKLTNYMTDLQRAAVTLNGIGRATRHGMTDERALEEGTKAANKVMGDLSHSSPLERNLLMTIMPFYGWTKHVLSYVASYPVDHPYRAVFLAYLANLNSDSVSKGLYTRIQNLFFLGQPDSSGNVSATDVRFLNPLRDVANDATLGGVISMLNPVISAPFAMVDPSVVFGSNTLYPRLTYNHLYGTEEGAPAGSPLTALEQFVPEVTALDASLGLSAQYRQERKDNPAGFAKTIFGALNIPFAQIQHINLRQIAAKQEMDRYNQAKADALTVAKTGDTSVLAGYPADAQLPDPLNPLYNVTPAYLAAMSAQSLAQTGLPFYATTQAPHNPPGI
jgi:hypothetical protein